MLKERFTRKMNRIYEYCRFMYNTPISSLVAECLSLNYPHIKKRKKMSVFKSMIIIVIHES